MDQLRLLGRVLIFGLFAAAQYILFLAAVPQVLTSGPIRNLGLPFAGYGHAWSRLKEVRDHPQVDILFIGSSHAYRGFDTRIYAARGFSSFNLGTSQQTPVQSEVLLLRHLDTLRPKLVIMTVHPTTYTSDGVESSLDILTNGPVDGFALRMAWRIGHLRTWNALLYNWTHQLLHGGVPDLKEPIEHGKGTYIPGGFVEHELRYHRKLKVTGAAGKVASPAAVRPVQTFVMRELQAKALERMIRMLQERNIELVLVETPVAQEYRERFKAHGSFAEQMHHAAHYIDMHVVMNLDDSLHFYDKSHLNRNGVLLFNTVLLERLKAEGSL